MKRIIGAFLATLVVVTTAFAVPSSWTPLLWQGQTVHDGMMLDFATQTYYVKAPGAPARYAPFTDLFTFTRNSKAGAFLNEAGVLDYANENTAIQTQTFDNASWTKGNATVTADSIAAPDGTTTADSLVEDGTAGVSHLVSQSQATTGTIQTFSVYLKASSRTWAAIQLGSFAAGSAFFNLSDCTVGTVVAGTTARAQTIGNGWCRVMVTNFPANANNAIYAASADNTVTYTGNSSTAIYMWGAQVQAGLAAKAYLPVTTTPKYDQPRLEFDVNGKPLGLLMETSRTNVILRNTALDNASWTKSNASISADFGTAPDGTTSSDKIVEDSATAIHGVIAGVTVTAGGTYTLSAFVRPAGRTFVFMYGINVDQYGAIFDLTNLTSANITSGTGSVTAKGIIPYPNGVYRVWVSGIMNGSATTLNFVGGPATSLSVPGGYTYLGNGSSGIEMWGVQIEAGSQPTSFMATVSASTTRAADAAARTLGSEYKQDAGAFYIRGRAGPGQDTATSQRLIVIHDGTDNERIHIARPQSADTARFSLQDGGVNQATIDAGSFVNLAEFQVAFAYALNDMVSVVSGTAAADTSGTMPTVTTMGLGEYLGTSQFNAHIKRLDYWPERKETGYLQRKTLGGP